MALCAPARFIFAAAMLQVENRVTLRLILIVARRRVHEAAKVRVGDLGIEVCLSQPSMRHVLDGVKVRIVRGNFHTASPATCTVKEQAARIRNCGAINPDLVVMKPFVLRRGLTDPSAVFAFDQRILHRADVEQDARGLWGTDSRAYTPLGINLRILLVGLIERRRFEILDRRLSRLRPRRCDDDKL